MQALGYQILAVDYDDQIALRYNLRGIDLIISTISGNPQINLIDAAAFSNVSRFIPAEFEGPPSNRPPLNPLDHGQAAALSRLQEYAASRRSSQQSQLRFTIFTCGIFYERFARGGLASKGIGIGSGVEHQGAYLMDIESGVAEVVERTLEGQEVWVCMTAIHDVARYLVAALELDLESWPDEFRMRGDRRSVTEIVRCGEVARGGRTRLLFPWILLNMLIGIRKFPSSLSFTTLGTCRHNFTWPRRTKTLPKPNAYKLWLPRLRVDTISHGLISARSSMPSRSHLRIG